jgi:tRNA 2-thiocytidine biosynthesis protein TtcA
MKLEAKLRRHVGRALQDYAMIAPGDVVCVGVSGGKDSYTLLDVLQRIQRRAPVAFELRAVLVDQGFPSFQVDVVEGWLREREVPFHVEETDTLAREAEVGAPGGSFCSFCASERRGLLYRAAERLGANKLALGHHRDDVIETLLMNMFFNGKLRGMPARLDATGVGKGMQLIRPLVYVPEELLRAYADEQRFPTVPCGCPTCGTTLQKRQWVKKLVGRLEDEVPGLKKSVLRAMQNVEAQQLLLDDDARQHLADRLRGPQAV